MTNYWAIAVGINQYRHFQPLMYAQWDAQSLYSFWCNEAGFLPQQCRLLTDMSLKTTASSTEPDIEPDASFDQDTVKSAIADICQIRLQPDDVFWCFLSGYGVHHEGHDYLMMADSDPTQLPQSGLAFREIFATLKAAPTDNLLVLLDIKRSQSSQTGTQVGTEIAALADEHRIATILSCQPDQFAHETLTLRQGLFTAALLEAFRSQGCITLEHLVQYLGDRLPELSEHHWRPRQEPLAIVPEHKRYQIILPGKPLPSPSMPTPAQPEPEEPQSESKLEAGDAEAVSITDDQESDDAFWQKFILWSGLAAALLLGGVFVSNRAFLTAPTRSDRTQPGAAQVNGNQPNSNQSLQASANSAEVPPAPTDTSSPEADSATQQPFEAALTALRDKRYEDVMTALDQVPVRQQDQQYADLRAEAEQLYAQARQANQAILNQAVNTLAQTRQVTATNQASDFHRAILQAQQIPVGQPLYEQAQQHIRRWSGVILDLAEARANMGNYSGAIAAAQLIPSSQSELYERGQQAIQTWQPAVEQQEAARRTIREARALIQFGQASSYSRAIARLRTISQGQPGYDEAQQLINAWSRDILSLARERAAWGSLYNAIDTAALVPQGTPPYQEARSDIERWRNQLLGG
jgi:uncharacterized caspase-like protein/tetratricopeptide (TPR) repeat protein